MTRRAMTAQQIVRATRDWEAIESYRPNLYEAEFLQMEPERHGIVVRTLVRIIESDSGFFLLLGGLCGLDVVALLECFR